MMHAGSSPIPIHIGACMQAIWYVATAHTACCFTVCFTLWIVCSEVTFAPVVLHVFKLN